LNGLIFRKNKSWRGDEKILFKRFFSWVFDYICARIYSLSGFFYYSSFKNALNDSSINSYDAYYCNGSFWWNYWEADIYLLAAWFKKGFWFYLAFFIFFGITILSVIYFPKGILVLFLPGIVVDYLLFGPESLATTHPVPIWIGITISWFFWSFVGFALGVIWEKIRKAT